jgi:hypothetical protein
MSGSAAGLWAHSSGPPAPFQRTHAALMQKPSGSDEHQAEDQKSDVPGKGSSEIVADVVDLEYLVIDQAFHHVENSPADENESEVEPPIRRQPSLAPGGNGHDRGSKHHEPHPQMEESVRECVYFEPRHRVGRIFRGMTQHVMPLKDLVQDDAIHETAEPKPVEKARCLRRGRFTDGRPQGPWSNHGPRLLRQKAAGDPNG